MTNRPKVLFLHNGLETFVKIDFELLSEFADVTDFYVKKKFPMGFLSYIVGIRSCDIVFCWFASWNAFWAIIISRIFRKRSVLIIGGYDLANIPEANYGHQRNLINKWISRLTIRLASALVTNSNFSQYEARINAKIEGTNLSVIYHGIPDPFWNLKWYQKENLVLTVGNVDQSNLKRKGLEVYVKAAELLPSVNFVMIGAWKDNSINYLQDIASANVAFLGRVDDKTLIDYFCKASVYVQASLHEGFGMSVAEAMLAGCIPVVSDCGALPEVVDEYGFYCDPNNPSNLSDVIVKALQSDEGLRLKSRNWILKKFTLETRKKRLEAVIRGLLQ